MKFSDFEKQLLANLVVDEIKEEFARIHLSGNLASNIKVIFESDKLRIEIPADTYNVWLYKNRGIVVYNGKGSYASEVDTKGGFSGKHTNFLNRCVIRAVEKFMAQLNINEERMFFK